jgi:hypothetical protein
MPASSASCSACGGDPRIARAEVEELYVTTIDDTSLGVEFSAGDLHGILSSRRMDAVVTNLWAGVTCIFR